MWMTCEPLNFQFCDIYQGMWIYAVTCHADCIRLIAGRGMNICHELSLSTVMQTHTVYSKCKKLLQSCCWKLKVNPTYGADLAHWTVILVPVTPLGRSPIVQQGECRSLISAMRVLKRCQVKTSASWCCGIVSKNSDCASFYECYSDYVYDTGNRTAWTVFFS